MLKIKKVYKHGFARELGLEKGDAILKFDGYLAQDVIDYYYYDSLTDFTLTVLTKQGETVTLEIQKEDFDSLGVEFENDNLDIKTCRNNCVFCFVDQMPKGLRPSLYVKDDDYRQSFLRGNFVTLTNVTSADVERIIRLGLSPLYVSVQATNPETRVKLLNNRFAGNILDILKKLTSNGIAIDAQVVLVKGLNDGAILEQTCKDLFALGKNLTSVSVVPCGITKFREGLYPIEDITSGYAKCVIEQVKNLNAEFKTNFVLLADEFYFKAGITPTNPDEYSSRGANVNPRVLEEIEVANGVGLTAKFLKEIESCEKGKASKGKKLIISGTSAHAFVSQTVENLKGEIKNLNADVIAVENNFFGATVNCTGLLVGSDIINAVKPIINEYSAVVLPCVCLKEGDDLFLDGVTLEEFKNALNVEIIITNGTGSSFVSALTDGKLVRKI